MSRMPCKFDDCRTPAPYVMDEDEAPREVCPGCDADRDLTRKTIAAPCDKHAFPGQDYWSDLVWNERQPGGEDYALCKDQELWDWAADAGQQTAALAAAREDDEKARRETAALQARLDATVVYGLLERQRLGAEVIEAQRRERMAVAETLHSPAARELAHRINESPR